MAPQALGQGSPPSPPGIIVLGALTSSSSTGPWRCGGLAGAWGWSPTLCNEGGCSCPKGPSAVRAVAPGAVQGHPSCPRHCCYGLPCFGPPLPLFPMCISGVPSWLIPSGLGAGPLAIPRACLVLPDPEQRGWEHLETEGRKHLSCPSWSDLAESLCPGFSPSSGCDGSCRWCYTS